MRMFKLSVVLLGTIVLVMTIALATVEISCRLLYAIL